MTTVVPKRVTAQIEGDFVVFLIGMRINKPWKVHKWLPVFRAMPMMIRELEQRPESGFVGAIRGFSVIVQYWRSFDQLEAYAGTPINYPGLLGSISTNESEGVRGTWASGTKPTESAPASTSVCTAGCHPSVWQEPARRRTPLGTSSRLGVGWRGSRAGRPSSSTGR